MKLNDKQKKAVFDLSGNIIVTASPGSGKTRTLVARAMHKLESISKYKSLALITYTNAGADEIASRLVSDKKIFIGTIHSFCLEYILRPFGWINQWVRPKVITFELQEKFFEENDDIDLEEEFGQNRFDELNKIQKKISGEIDCDVEWNHNISLNEAASRYYNFQLKYKVIDFNEILFRSYKLVSENFFVAESLSSTFSEILVDEFQDTNLYQYEILKMINAKGDCTFFMVGDEKQKIFSFAGAIEDAFGKAQEDFKARLEILTETYRSTDNIVNTYCKLFDNHPLIENKSENKDLDTPVYFFETKKDNHTSIIHSIVEQLLEKMNIDISEIAILSTSWFSAYPISKSLRAKYEIVGLGALPHKYLNNSTTALLKSLSRYYFKSNIRNLRSLKRNFEIYTLDNDLLFSEREIQSKINLLINSFLSINIENTLENGLLEVKDIYKDIFNFNDETFGEVIGLIANEEKGDWSIQKYLKTLSGVEGITSNTIHKVKGLEFDVVILNEMNENKIPYQKCISSNPWEYEELSVKGIEEGRNLLYVATSRARKCLIILHNWKPSMFIEKIK